MTAKNPRRIPKVCKHRATGRAYVRLEGRCIYLGPHTDPKSLERGHRLIAEWLANGGRLRVAPEAVTLTEICAAYIEHVEGTFRRADGTPSAESIRNVGLALAVPRRFYGTAPAVEFGPLALRACIAQWVAAGLRRTTVNKRLGDVKRAFKWAVSMEMLPPSTFQALSTVEGLRHGRCNAKESRVVSPVTKFCRAKSLKSLRTVAGLLSSKRTAPSTVSTSCSAR